MITKMNQNARQKVLSTTAQQAVVLNEENEILKNATNSLLCEYQ